MQNQQEWNTINEEDRNRMTEIYQNNEREVRGKADLAIETVSIIIIIIFSISIFNTFYFKVKHVKLFNI